MTTLSREQLVNRPFVDKKHYPYGFARSGDFSITESKLLQAHGSLFAALVDGKITPSSEAEINYLNSALGQCEPATPQARAWVKYQTRINRPKAASIYGSKRVVTEELDDNVGIDDDNHHEIDIDDD
ncbi:DUF413 domain-containing protein [Alteromonas sp. 1_MG-2023]|uniref:DUF413 domain-containing protein n=1 Tax=Alteromonas sp. 1_MG-2023 TaxID=3062669 RepID=UPI0026E1B8E5|nr:DUF413 domain-containing protein [Alteromonas sp. 1_MG-2023]MDO6568930.1 DUF413 domain-containing protein [Alteromonas sp. 1_MG-2023]